MEQNDSGHCFFTTSSLAMSVPQFHVVSIPPVIINNQSNSATLIYSIMKLLTMWVIDMHCMFDKPLPDIHKTCKDTCV
jgi:hypothetical protein